MKLLKKPRDGKLAKLFLVFILMYVSEDVLLFATNSDKTLFNVKMVVLPVLIIGMLLWNIFHRRNYSKASIIWVLATILNVAITCGLMGELDNRNLYSVVMILLSVTVVNNVTESEFVDCYTKIMMFLAVFSLIQYLVFLIIYPVTLWAPQVVNINGLQFSNWIFTNSLNREYYEIMPYRNWGIYREPGVYVVFLMLALIFELFFREKPKKINVIVFVLTIFTTFSTAGYIVAAIVILVYVFQFKENMGKKLVTLLGVATGAAAIIVVLNLLDVPIYHWVFEKLTREGGSADSRFGSVLSNLFLFARSPLWGNGWVKMAQESETIQTVIVTEHNTNTQLIFFAVYGITYGIAMLGGSIRFFTGQKRGLVGLLLALCWIMALSNENLTLNVVVYLIAVYGWVKPRYSEKNIHSNEMRVIGVEGY